MQEIIAESEKSGNGVDGEDNNNNNNKEEEEADEVIISGDGTWRLENHEKHKAEIEGASSLRFHHRHTEAKKSSAVLTIDDKNDPNGNEIIILD